MKTGIYIRMQIDGKWQSVDVADPRISAPRLLHFLAPKDDQWILELIKKVRETILAGDKNA
jgi:hypothetical protein